MGAQQSRVWKLVRFFSLESKKHPGTLDHGKFWTTVVLIVALVANFIAPFPPAMIVILGSLACGPTMWFKFLESRVITGTVGANFDVAKSFSDAKSTTQNLTKIVIEKAEHALDPDGIFSQPTTE